MKYIFSLVFICLIGTACTPPDGLIGGWEADRKECLLSEDKSILNDEFKGSDRYELSFLSDSEFRLSYFNQQFNVDKVNQSGEQEQVRAKKCRVSYMGTYSYNFITGLSLTFSKEEGSDDEEEQFYQTTTEGQCGLVSDAQQLKISTLPDTQFFKDDTSVIIKSVSDEDLHLNFSDFEHCTNDEMTVVFKRKTE